MVEVVGRVIVVLLVEMLVVVETVMLVTVSVVVVGVVTVTVVVMGVVTVVVTVLIDAEVVAGFIGSRTIPNSYQLNPVPEVSSPAKLVGEDTPVSLNSACKLPRRKTLLKPVPGEKLPPWGLKTMDAKNAPGRKVIAEEVEMSHGASHGPPEPFELCEREVETPATSKPIPAMAGLTLLESTIVILSEPLEPRVVE